MTMPKGEGKLIAQNKKARHDYHILETFEAGVVLQGTEIKSIRNSRINLKDGFVRVRNGEVFLVNVHISPYEQGNIFNHDPLRTRKLLLHKCQIRQLEAESKNAGITDRKSTRLNSSHVSISYAVFCLKKKNKS